MIKNLGKQFKEKLLCPIVSSFIIVGIVFLIFMPLFAQSQLNAIKAIDDITNKTDDQIRKCGIGYWISWIVIDQSRKQFYFQDVRGLNKDATAIISPKALKLNPYYLGIHSIDQETIRFLSSFENGVAGYYADLSFFSNLSVVQKVLKVSNKNIKSVGVSVTKNIFTDIVYVFLMTATSDSNSEQCDKTQIVNHLEDLSIYAKGRL